MFDKENTPVMTTGALNGKNNVFELKNGVNLADLNKKTF